MSTESTTPHPLHYRYGLHRVIEPQGVLPQSAWRVDNSPAHSPQEGAEHELVIEVERLNIDAASFRQMEDEARAAGEDLSAGVRKRVQATIDERGKMHNPVTGSGGMLLGRVARVGTQLGEPHRSLRVGDQIATLVSLSLTPLHVREIQKVHLHTHQVEVQGTAILFESGVWARLPDYLPQTVALSALDVAGAGPQVTRLCTQTAPGKQVEKVLVLGGGGKSGLLVAAAARAAGVPLIVGVESYEPAANDAESVGLYNHLLRADARDALRLAEAATEVAGGEFDLVVSCVSAPKTEMAAILSTRTGGTIYFFSMATSFTAAALGAEGVSKDVDMLIGNGYCLGHADDTLELLHTYPKLRELFIRRYG